MLLFFHTEITDVPIILRMRSLYWSRRYKPDIVDIFRFKITMARFDTNRDVQPNKQARGFKFRIKKVDALYYL